MHQIVNLSILGAIGVCVYVALYRNLYECAMVLGRCFFALLLGLALFGPAGRAAAGMFGIPPAYSYALSFFLIWIIVVGAFESLAGRLVKETGRGMEFNHERPGRVAIALISGCLAGLALMVNLVMLPPVEGLFFRNDAQPVAHVHRKAAALYAALTLSRTDVVTPAQMEAGAHWLEGELRQRLRDKDMQGAEELVGRFIERYTRVLESEEVKARREEIVNGFRKSIDRVYEVDGVSPKPGTQKSPPAETSEAEPGPSAPESGLVRTQVPPTLDLSSVRALVAECRFDEALAEIAALRKSPEGRDEAERLRRKEERLQTLQQMHQEIGARVAADGRRALSAAAPGGGLAVLAASIDAVTFEAAGGARVTRPWSGLDEATLIGIFESYLSASDPCLAVLREELLVPNAIRLHTLAASLKSLDRQIAAGLAGGGETDALRGERGAVVAEMAMLLQGAGRYYDQKKKEWNEGLRTGHKAASPEMVRAALAMQQTVRTALPFLEPLSWEQISGLFGKQLMVHAGQGLLLRYALLRPGEFMMGSADGPRGEGPAHAVIITRPFYMAVRETTVAAYAQVSGSPKRASGPQHPVTRVSWHEATAFCDKLAELTGLPVRLPTEAQWEYACRAGDLGPGPKGRELDEMAWHEANSEQKVHEVGSKRPNAWGLCDMLGNAWEWCRDWYSADYYAHSRGAADPQGPDSGAERAVRGAGITTAPHLVTPSTRYKGLPTYASEWVGFRTVIELSP